ncbi:MAG: DUF1080 domain-containing protein [Verrucomicrobiota bacterium]|jgi:hypothetical protein|nr:MAG: DUF1080 domain-containing protein [Verrucomicrobiota bacterium]
MKYKLLSFTLLSLSLSTAGFAEEWQELFNGKDLTGWKANTHPDSFSVVDGLLKAHATNIISSHLFYIGDQTSGTVNFKNFELEATVRCDGIANSGIFFDTAIDSGEGPHLHLGKGYEVQLNNQDRDQRKTGSLYAVVDLLKSPVDETQWFKIRFRVVGKHVVIWVNDKQVVDYTEESPPKRGKGREKRVIDPNGGAIALQAHDPSSTYYFKNIRIKKIE